MTFLRLFSIFFVVVVLIAKVDFRFVYSLLFLAVDLIIGFPNSWQIVLLTISTILFMTISSLEGQSRIA